MISVEGYVRDHQARLFEKSAELGYDSESFINCFMKSRLAEGLDSDYSRFQWADEEYWLDELKDEFGDRLKKGGRIFGPDTLFWMGYLYRSWHDRTGESSSEILKYMKPRKLAERFLALHVYDIGDAVDIILSEQA